MNFATSHHLKYEVVMVGRALYNFVVFHFTNPTRSIYRLSEK